MITVDLEQGTDEWKDWRDSHWGASDANKLMGPSKKRSALLHEKVTGEKEKFDKWTLERFAKGHRSEAAARPIVERKLEQPLATICGVIEPHQFPEGTPEGVIDTLSVKLSASFDGITPDGKLIWEHKDKNLKLIESLEQGLVPATHCWQLEHQLLVSGAEKAIMCSSDGTAQNMHMAFYTSKPERRAKLIEAWMQFSQEVDNYLPPIDASKLEDFQSLENRRSLIADQLVDLTQQEESIKAEMRAWHKVNAHERQSVQGREWHLIPIKGRSTINYDKAIKAEAPHIDLEKYRVTGKESISIRRVK